MKKQIVLKTIASFLCVAMVITCAFEKTIYASTQETTTEQATTEQATTAQINKLSAPTFMEEGVYIIPLGEDFCETLTSAEQGSEIYYSVYGVNEDETKDKEKQLYTAPIPIDPNRDMIKAVSKKDGFEDSEEVVRKYLFAFCSPPFPYDGIEVYSCQKGKDFINGNLIFNSELPVYIKCVVKRADGTVKRYHTKTQDYDAKKQDKRAWKVELDAPLKTGDKVTVSAYVKEYLVRLTKESEGHMLVFQEGVPNSTWNTVTKTIEDKPLTSPQMGDIY